MYFLLTIYSWCWFCTPEWLFCRSLLSKRLWNLFLCYRRHKQFVVPVTECSPWDDFVALRRQAGQHALALGHVQVVDDRGLIHSQLDQINWCCICHGKFQCILAEQRNGIFSNLTVNLQGTCDDGIQLNMTLTWQDRLEVNWQGLLLSRLEKSRLIFSNILAVRTSIEVSSIPRILLKEISILYLDFLSFPVGLCWTDNFSFGTLQD